MTDPGGRRPERGRKAPPPHSLCLPQCSLCLCGESLSLDQTMVATKPQPIKITLGADKHEWKDAEGCLATLKELGRVHGSSRQAYRDAAARLGSMLLQLRAQAPYGTWKNLLARADIAERFAQTTMGVAVEIAPSGEIDLNLVEKMRAAARANGCKLAFVQTDEELKSWNQAVTLVRAAKVDRKFDQTEPPHSATTLSVLERDADGDGEGEPGESASLVGDDAVAKAWGMSVEEYREYVAELDAEGAEGQRGEGARTAPDLHPSAPLPLCPSAPVLPRGAAGPQLGLDALFIQRERLVVRLEHAMALVSSRSVEAGTAAAAMDECERVLARLGV